MGEREDDRQQQRIEGTQHSTDAYFQRRRERMERERIEKAQYRGIAALIASKPLRHKLGIFILWLCGVGLVLAFISASVGNQDVGEIAFLLIVLGVLLGLIGLILKGLAFVLGIGGG
jgi:hypothetical protein